MSCIDIPLEMRYNKENYNCASLVCQYYRGLGWADSSSLPDGDMREFNSKALLWIKNNFVKIDKMEKHCLIVCKNFDGSLHVAVFDGQYVVHNSNTFGGVIRQLLPMFLRENKNIRIYKWRS